MFNQANIRAFTKYKKDGNCAKLGAIRVIIDIE
jgi:hypothetical protein